MYGYHPQGVVSVAAYARITPTIRNAAMDHSWPRGLEKGENVIFFLNTIICTT